MDEPVAEFEVRRNDGTVILSISGELDVASAADFDLARAEALSTGLPVVIDLAECEFIDSSGVAGIIRTFDRATDADQPFALAGSGPQVRRVLDLSGMSQMLPYFRSLDEAIRHVS
jgi:anti-sigma B factor antagonist